ncbi:aspartate/glutamate racemase family protein [Roseomonas sp. BN140053]|uniref:aspartate/glutamate racemase family protein n=1 Tax=Roseomonas sp. BN140053 TaxID=3391898 RepID=UPI0039EA5D85
MRLLLLNPNTSANTTAAMLAIARDAAPDGVTLSGATAPHGAALITEAAALATAAGAVLSLVPALRQDPPDGVVLAAFGDPGLEELRAALPCSVTGLAEAGMAEAAAFGRGFAVVTTTPGLVDSITCLAAGYGHAAAFRGVYLTPGEPAAVMADPARLREALAQACEAAVAAGAGALVIGGGPLATAARALAGRFPVPLVEPVPAAIRLALVRAGG